MLRAYNSTAQSAPDRPMQLLTILLLGWLLCSKESSHWLAQQLRRHDQLQPSCDAPVRLEPPHTRVHTREWSRGISATTPCRARGDSPRGAVAPAARRHTTPTAQQPRRASRNSRRPQLAQHRGLYGSAWRRSHGAQGRARGAEASQRCSGPTVYGALSEKGRSACRFKVQH